MTMKCDSDWSVPKEAEINEITLEITFMHIVLMQAFQ